MAETLDLDRLLSGLRRRRTDPETGTLVKEALSKSLPDSPAKAYEYLVESMEPVPRSYTERTFKESERIEKQLQRALSAQGFDVEFANQGSATNGTHIKVHSDIDLLVCTKVFFYLEPPMTPQIPWEGDPIAHIRALRTACEKALGEAYPAAAVEAAGARALSISGGSLRRRVDVVPGSWLHGTDYLASGDPEDLGVKILDLKGPKLIANYPFHHNREIDRRDAATGGKLRRLIRLLKSLRADGNLAEHLSSYDIAGLCFNVPVESISDDFSAADLLRSFVVFAVKVGKDPALRAALVVPNGTRSLFEPTRAEEMLGDLLTLAGATLELVQVAERRRNP
jgi:hypothetical protein